MSRRTKIILIPLLLFWGGPKALALYTDWLWFADLGFEEVYRTRLLAQVTLFSLGAALFVGLFFGSAVLARRLSGRAIVGVEFPGSPQVRAMEGSFNLAVIGGGILFGLMMAGSMAGRWGEVLRFLRATPFGAADPLFGRDVAFFVFALPVYRFVQGWLLTVGLLALLVAVAAYGFRIVLPQMSLEGGDGSAPRLLTSFRLILSRPMRAHLFGLGALLLGFIAWGYRLSIYELVYSPRGAAFGASYADIHARLPRCGSSSPWPCCPPCSCLSASPARGFVCQRRHWAYGSPPRSWSAGSIRG